MDSRDLSFILEGRLALHDALKKKIETAAQKRNRVYSSLRNLRLQELIDKIINRLQDVLDKAF